MLVGMQRVVITDYWESGDVEQTQLTQIARVDCLQASHESDLKGKVADVDGVILCHEISLTAEILPEFRQCKTIVRCGVGYDNVDLEAAGRQGIQVCNVPDYGVDEVADHAIAMMLACNRGLFLADRRLRMRLTPWDMRAVEPIFRIRGSVMGIIGLGRIGSATAIRAQGLGMEVIAYDPFLRPGMDKVLRVKRVSLEELLSTADVVSVHTPLDQGTRNLIDAEAIAKMKSSAILVNTSRGAVVNTDAVADALRKRTIAAAGIDVLETEPATADMKLIQLWQDEKDPTINLIVTPHTAFYSEQGLREMREKAAQEVARVLRGERPQNCVNEGYLPRRTPQAI